MERPFIQLLLIQFREYFREPGVLFWSFIFPLVTAWGLGIAFSGKPEQKREIAYIQDNKQQDTSFRKILLGSKLEYIKEYNSSCFIIRTGDKQIGTTIFRLIPTTLEKANKLVKQGNVVMIIQEKENKTIYHYDPHNTDAQLSYYQICNLNIKKSQETQIQPLTQKGTRYVDFFIPGLLAMNLMMSTMWGVSYSLIEKRSKKLLRRLVATPMRKSEFLISQLISRLVLNIIESFILFIFAYFYFNITVEGSLLALIMVYFSGMLCFTGIAILCASRTAKTYIGNGLINAVVMPMMLISGIFFSYHNFPDSIIPYIQVLPLTLLADGIRGIFIEGHGILQAITPMLILSCIGIFTFGLGMKIYKWY